MKKKLIIVMLVCIMGILNGCSTDEGSTGAVEIDTKQFEVLSKESIGEGGDIEDELIIIKHKEIEKNLLYIKDLEKVE